MNLQLVCSDPWPSDEAACLVQFTCLKSLICIAGDMGSGGREGE